MGFSCIKCDCPLDIVWMLYNAKRFETLGVELQVARMKGS